MASQSSPPSKTFEGWVAHDATNPLTLTTFEPKPFTETDVEIKVTHCGICGTDVHTLRSGWGPTDYPCVVGHEIIGIVERVGASVPTLPSSPASRAIRIGDLGLARLFHKPLNSLFSGDKVVVTIWYRAPELLMGSRHYTPAVDLWAVGCIFAELLSLRPIFKGEEAKMDSKKTVPFQRNQMMRIIEIMGMPRKESWPGLATMPEYSQLQSLTMSRGGGRPSGLDTWYQTCLKNGGYGPASNIGTPGSEGFDLLARLLEYDPTKRITAQQALEHPYFTNGAAVSADCFQGLESRYPHRRVTQDDSNMRTGSLPGTKRSGLDDSLMGRAAKRLKE